MWQFMIDVTIMGVTFTNMQYVGFTLLFSFYGLLATKYAVKARC
jgi:hypothetical protein